MKTAKKIAICGAFCALLIAIQYPLGAIKGIELVTVFFYAFCFVFGGACGVLVAVCYTLLRCFLHGFFPTVIILYLIYYPIFSLVGSAVGKTLKNSSPVRQIIFSVITTVLLTLFFHVADNIVTPLFFSYDKKTWIAYILQSVPVCITQCVCAGVSTALLFQPLKKAFLYVNKNVGEEKR